VRAVPEVQNPVGRTEEAGLVTRLFCMSQDEPAEFHASETHRHWPHRGQCPRFRILSDASIGLVRFVPCARNPNVPAGYAFALAKLTCCSEAATSLSVSTEANSQGTRREATSTQS